MVLTIFPKAIVRSQDVCHVILALIPAPVELQYTILSLCVLSSPFVETDERRRTSLSALVTDASIGSYGSFGLCRVTSPLATRIILSVMESEGLSAVCRPCLQESWRVRKP